MCICFKMSGYDYTSDEYDSSSSNDSDSCDYMTTNDNEYYTSQEDNMDTYMRVDAHKRRQRSRTPIRRRRPKRKNSFDEDSYSFCKTM